MKYVSTKDIAARWNINERSVRRYCERGQIDGASQVDGAWIIPDDSPKPKHLDREPPIYDGPARQVVAQRAKNNHYGIYEYLQVNLAYSSSRMASNRLTRKQVIELYRTGKVSIGFEPLKVDDVFVSFGLVVSGEFVERKVEGLFVLDYRFVERREHNIAFVAVVDGANHKTVIFSCVATYDGGAHITTCAVCGKHLSLERVLKISQTRFVEFQDRHS